MEFEKSKRAAKEKIDPNGNEKVECLVCSEYYHRLDVHLKNKHSLTIEMYQERFPGAEVVSASAKKIGAGRRRQATEPDQIEIAEEDHRHRIGVALIEPRNADEMDEFDRAFIPAHDENWNVGERELRQWEAMALEISHGGNVLWVGPTGCGKSSGTLELASLINQPVRRVNLNGDVRSAHFVGEKLVEVDEATGQSVIRFRYGVLADAMRRGHWLLLDELDAAPPPILFVLQAVLEDHGKLVLLENGGEVITPHASFRIIATANTLGRGDETGLYAGTNVLNEAFLDRFGTVIVANYPEETTEVQIVVAKSGIDMPNAERMVRVAQKIREAYAKEEVYCTLSTRRLINWARKTKAYGNARRAAELTVLNRLATDDRKVVDGVVQRYFGSGAPAVAATDPASSPVDELDKFLADKKKKPKTRPAKLIDVKEEA